jgi:hypothetical protein
VAIGTEKRQVICLPERVSLAFFHSIGILFAENDQDLILKKDFDSFGDTLFFF